MIFLPKKFNNKTKNILKHLEKNFKSKNSEFNFLKENKIHEKKENAFRKEKRLCKDSY